MKIQNKKGFSLIELSIVLIIIGLLVAGITGGAALIKGAEVRSIITEANQYTVAVNTFYMSEGSLPGDGTDGDKNGRIEHIDTKSTPVLEGLAAWKDLSDKGLIDFTSTDTAGTGKKLTPSETIPASKYKGIGWTFDYSTDTGSNVLVMTGEIADGTASSAINGTMLKPYATMDPEAAKSVDVKMDDGKPLSGSVRGYNDAGDKATNGTCIATDEAYKTNGSANTCSISVNLTL